MKKTAYLLFAIGISFVTCFSASAQTIIHTEDFTVNQTRLFDFLSFTGNNNFTPMGLQIAIPDAATLGTADNFGGLGVAPQVPVNLNGVTNIEVTAQLDAGNASDIVLSIREGIAGAAGDGEFFSITVPQSLFTTGSFTTVNIDLANPPIPIFNGDFPANPGSNGVLDGVLGNTGIQNPFEGTATSNFTVQSVTFINDPPVVVPEPSSLALLFGLGSIIGVRRRRS